MRIHPETPIGHVHLTVADLDRSLRFYRDVLGFQVTTRYGSDAVFLSAGGYHHHIGLNTWAGSGAPAPPPGTTGLYHFAILYPDGNGVELYRDRPEPDWPRGPDGTLAMHTKPLDLEKLLADEE